MVRLAQHLKVGTPEPVGVVATCSPRRYRAVSLLCDWRRLPFVAVAALGRRWWRPGAGLLGFVRTPGVAVTLVWGVGVYAVWRMLAGGVGRAGQSVSSDRGVWWLEEISVVAAH